MPASWLTFEDRVRDLASYIWGKPCNPQSFGKVDVDGVINHTADAKILIEITERRELNKVREDVIKLNTAKADLFVKGIFAHCFCVVDGEITQGMRGAGAANHIKVVSIKEFTRFFFNFADYFNARVKSAFGSSVNPVTGDVDLSKYVPVKYSIDNRKGSFSVQQVAELARSGKNLIILGEYGSGKSRCIREIFQHLSENADAFFSYPIAIDLRKSWGLTRGSELLRRHFSDLAFPREMEDNALRAFRSGALILLLDGFDEIGSQAWSNDGQRLKNIRARALDGVRDLIDQSKNGAVICGREHYFPDYQEMFSALGLKQDKTVIVRLKDEFSETEMLEYFSENDIDVDLPQWLPRRPLICQTINNLAKDQLESFFGDKGNEIEFWNHFIAVLCERDARIHVSFDADIIYRIFMQLSRITRSKASDVGPISLAELQGAFETATGEMPVEEASLMLQRLPSLGKISTESNDRQFIDMYIMDGLRAKDLCHIAKQSPDIIAVAASSRWVNGLDDLGQRVLASDKSLSDESKLDFARKSLAGGNTVMASDFCGSLMRSNAEPIEFKGIKLRDGEFKYLNLSERIIKDLTLEDTSIGNLVFPVKGAEGTSFVNCVALRVSGVATASALPSWIKGFECDLYDSVASVSRVRSIGLSPLHEILVVIVRKTFFQRGQGRKEEALLRGLGNIATKGTLNKILNLMISEGLLTKFRGNEGDVYAPIRAHTQRMQEMLDSLTSSSDPIWIAIGKL